MALVQLLTYSESTLYTSLQKSISFIFLSTVPSNIIKSGQMLPENGVKSLSTKLPLRGLWAELVDEDVFPIPMTGSNMSTMVSRMLLTLQAQRQTKFERKGIGYQSVIQF